MSSQPASLSPSAASQADNVTNFSARPSQVTHEYSSVTVVPHSALLPADSPRIGGQDLEHVRTLAEQSGPLPPILVHRSTMRVIDGMHRLRASMLREEGDIAVRFFDGTPEEAFVLAVQANARHGLPLSQVDRAAAASRILVSHPDWSDSAIAAIAGLSDKTVSAIRARSTSDVPKLPRRLGRDGRLRPVDPVEGRQRALDYLASQPNAPIRKIAEAAGIAPATARDVRNRIRNGQDPLPARLRPVNTTPSTGQRAIRQAASPAPTDLQAVVHSRQEALEALKADPSLRLTDTGRTMLRMLNAHAAVPGGYEQLADAVPTHCLQSVLELARGCVQTWTTVVKHLESRSAGPQRRDVRRTK